MSKKASDVLSRMRGAATRDKPISTTPEAAPEVARAGTSEETGESGPRAAKVKPVRYTIDLSREQHRFLKRFAFDAEVDTSKVVRALLTRLEEDPQLRDAVLEQISK
jgi:hypothetical protein